MIFRGFTFSGTSSDDLMTSSDTCHAAVEPGDSCSVQIRFVPQAQGSRSATLTALTDAVTDPSTLLSGSAGPPANGSDGPRRSHGPRRSDWTTGCSRARCPSHLQGQGDEEAAEGQVHRHPRHTRRAHPLAVDASEADSCPRDLARSA